MFSQKSVGEKIADKKWLSEKGCDKNKIRSSSIFFFFGLIWNLLFSRCFAYFLLFHYNSGQVVGWVALLIENKAISVQLCWVLSLDWVWQYLPWPLHVTVRQLNRLNMEDWYYWNNNYGLIILALRTEYNMNEVSKISAIIIYVNCKNILR